nr:hypothetical protein [Lachnospiraceae bacterium]
MYFSTELAKANKKSYNNEKEKDINMGHIGNIKKILLMLIASMVLLSACGKDKGSKEQDINREMSAEEVLEDEGASADVKDEKDEVKDLKEASSESEDHADEAAYPRKEPEKEEEFVPKYPELYLEYIDHSSWDENYVQCIVNYTMEKLKLSAESEDEYPELAEVLNKYGEKKREIITADFDEHVKAMGVPDVKPVEEGAPIYGQNMDLLVRRADGKLISFVERVKETSAYSYSGDYYRFETHTLDMKTGEELTLSDVASDEDALMEMLLEKLAQRDIWSDVFEGSKEEIRKRINGCIDIWKKEKGIKFTVDPYGITFYFDTYDLCNDPLTQTVFFSEDEKGRIFNKEWCREIKEYMMAIPFDVYCSYPDNADEDDMICVSADYEEGLVKGFYISSDENEEEKTDPIPTKEYTSSPRAFIVHRDDKNRIICEYGSSFNGYVDMFDINGDAPILSDRLNGIFTLLPNEETDWKNLDHSPKSVPVDPDCIRVTPTGMSVVYEYKAGEDGKFEAVGDTAKLIKEKVLDMTYSDEYEAYSEILSCYRALSTGEYSMDDFKNRGLRTAFEDYPLPDDALSNGSSVGYGFYDADDDGIEELFITYKDKIYDVYGFEGKKPVYAYGLKYRSEAEFYKDGLLRELFGSNTGAFETWYKYDGNVGRYLPVVEKSYSPAGSSSDTEYYLFSAGESTDDID